MNLSVIVFLVLAVLALIIFLITRNKKDEKDFEQQLNEDYPKTKDEEGDIETDDK